MLINTQDIFAIENDESTNNSYDIFDIKKIYPTKENGQEWYINMDDPLDDNQFRPFDVTNDNFKLIQNDDSDKSWKLLSKNEEAKVRMNVLTSDGYDIDKSDTKKHKKLAKKEYIQSPEDWKNIEMTAYIKLNNYNIDKKDGKFQWFNRGGYHTDSRPCEGAGYKGNLFFNGDVRFAKEQWHVSYVFTDKKNFVDDLEENWIGYKYVVYNIEDPEDEDKIVVKMENWIDKNSDGNWVKANEYIDSGKWGKKDKKCDGKKDQIITWGGPVSTFRWDYADDVDFKFLSVREIATSLDEKTDEKDKNDKKKKDKKKDK
ncbi:MAG: carbohydrate-binding protein [Nitrososphaeraceae archaeon]